MKILIIEDNPTKLEKIRSIINKEYNHKIQMDYTSKLEDAKNLLDNTYDLFILDFSIKSKDHDSSIDYGIELFNIIKEQEGVEKILGYSTFDNMVKEHKEITESIKFIDYKSKANWEKLFIGFLNNFIVSNKIIIENVYDIAIITALDDEFEYMKKASNSIWFLNKRSEDDLFNFYTTSIENINGDTVNIVAYTMNEMGMSYSSALATKMLIKFKPKYLVMTGICAGFEGKTKKGDIIIPEFIFNYQSGDIREDGKFTPLYKTEKLDGKLKKIIRGIKDNYTYGRDIRDEWREMYPNEKVADGDQEIHIDKSFGTGSAVVKDGAILKEIQDKNVKNLIGLDMEAYSVMIAKEFADEDNPVVSLVIKAVQDFANKEKDKTYRNFSSYASARYFFKMCEDRLITEIYRG